MMDRFDELCKKIIAEMAEKTPFDKPYEPSDAMKEKRKADGLKWDKKAGDWTPTAAQKKKDDAAKAEREKAADTPSRRELVQRFKEVVAKKIDEAVVDQSFKRPNFKAGSYIEVSFAGTSTFRRPEPCVKYVKVTDKLEKLLNSGDVDKIKKVLWTPFVNFIYAKDFKNDPSLDISEAGIKHEETQTYKLHRVKQITPDAFSKIQKPDMLDLSYDADGKGLPIPE